MSITDGLREIAAKTECANGRCEKLYRGDLDHIADRIDAEPAERYVELPKDADGEYIHIGDVMESGDGDVFTVSSVDYGLHPSNGRGKFWMLWNEDADFYECAYECRHHHEPTVEDVLRQIIACANNGTRVHGALDTEQIVAEYAAKLRLAGDAE